MTGVVKIGAEVSPLPLVSQITQLELVVFCMEHATHAGSLMQASWQEN